MSGPLIGSTPEPNCSAKRVDLCRLTNWTRDGSGSILIFQGADGPSGTTMRVRVDEEGSWWVGAHYRLSIEITPVMDPIGDEMNHSTIQAMAIQAAVERLRASGAKATECYRVIDKPIAIPSQDYSVLQLEARKVECSVRWLLHVLDNGRHAQIAFLCQRSDLTDDELRSLIEQEPA